MAQNKFKGLGIALITPFKTDGSIDWDALARLVEYQLTGGADFLCVMGTTAETPTLTAEEKKQLKETLVERVNGRVPILLGLGGNSTRAVVEELKTGDFRGIDGILSVVVLYNVPGRTGVNMTAETTLRLARDFDNIVAIKEASGNISQMDDIIKNKPKNFDVISGDDGITFPLITLGAVGVISVIGNALPGEFSKMVRLALKGEYDSALKIHHQFTELFKLLFVDGNPAGVKVMLSEMGMIENQLRLPLVPTRLTTMQQISQIIKDLGIKL